MQKIIFSLAVIILIKLNYDFYLIDVNRYKNILNLIKNQQLNNINLQIRNNNLSDKISAVKGNNIALEARARYELNLIKKDEKLLILPNNYNFKLNKDNKLNLN
jgi:cell division protein FtsB